MWPKLMWAVSGFVCGAAFWHFIGFWSTVNDLVLRGPVRDQAEHFVSQAGEDCTLVAHDRRSGGIAFHACPSEAVVLHEAETGRRNRLRPEQLRPTISESNWSVTVSDIHVETAPPPSERDP